MRAKKKNSNTHKQREKDTEPSIRPHFDSINLVFYLFSGIREEIDAFRNDKCHSACGANTARFQEWFPCAIMFTLTPPIWPSQNDCVRFQATQTTRLNTKHERRKKIRTFLKNLLGIWDKHIGLLVILFVDFISSVNFSIYYKKWMKRFHF